MIHVGEVVIDTPVEQILEQLKIDLAEVGMVRFEKIRRTNSNVMTQCPFHADGLEKKPSFGISDSGECHCFACGWSSKYFDQFISELFGYFDGGEYGRSWVYTHLNDSSMNRSIQLNFGSKKQAVSKSIISEEILDSYRYIHPYMYQRHLTDEIIDEFDIGYDRERRCITFPIKDLEGDVIYVATRSVNSKFFMLPEGENKPIYCADRFVSGKYKKAVIVESFLNALTCWKFGIPAMALIGTGSSTQMSILRNLPVRHYVLALDPDDAGRKGMERIKIALRGYKILTMWKLPKGKDVNDLDSEILNLKESFI